MYCCILGTVLAINGFRKYYNIYHPKTINLRRSAGEGGEFIGFDDDSSESDSEGASVFSSVKFSIVCIMFYSLHC